jgi:hypothetical protein
MDSMMSSERNMKSRKFTVYQFQMTDADYNEANENSRKGVPIPEKYELYLSATLRPSNKSILNAAHHYTKVAVITAKSIDDAFTIGNIGLDSESGLSDMIEKIAPMHSVSVGDILVDEKGVAKYVAPIGFKRIKYPV